MVFPAPLMNEMNNEGYETEIPSGQKPWILTDSPDRHTLQSNTEELLKGSEIIVKEVIEEVRKGYLSEGVPPQ